MGCTQSQDVDDLLARMQANQRRVRGDALPDVRAPDAAEGSSAEARRAARAYDLLKRHGAMADTDAGSDDVSADGQCTPSDHNDAPRRCDGAADASVMYGVAPAPVDVAAWLDELPSAVAMPDAAAAAASSAAPRAVPCSNRSSTTALPSLLSGAAVVALPAPVIPGLALVPQPVVPVG